LKTIARLAKVSRAAREICHKEVSFGGDKTLQLKASAINDKYGSYLPSSKLTDNTLVDHVFLAGVRIVKRKTSDQRSVFRTGFALRECTDVEEESLPATLPGQIEIQNGAEREDLSAPVA
jgi:hypothetical protein